MSIELVSIIAVGLISLIAILNWRMGVWMILVVGFLQDPIRKIIPEQPGYFTVLVAVVFVAVLFGLLLRGYSFRPSEVPGWRGGVSQAMVAFVVLLFFQLINSFFRSGSIFIVGLGVLGYVVPILAIFSGYYFACHFSGKTPVLFLWGYCVGCLIFTAGIYMQYFGYEFSSLGEVGVGLKIYDFGTILTAYSGFFRSSELAAWHIFMGSSFSLILLFSTNRYRVRFLLALGVVFLIAAGILTGRRKLIVSVIIFGITYWALSLFYLKHSFRVAAVLFLLGMTIVGVFSQNQFIQGNDKLSYDLYVERGSGVFGDINERAQSLGFSSVFSAVKEFGLFGKGAGSYSQGARFVGVGERTGGWQAEGGFGRVVIELGLVGLILLFWLLILMSQHFQRILKYVSIRNVELTQICIGITAILIANIAHFFVASQVFGDPFVLLILGLLAGFVISLPVQLWFLDQDIRKRVSSAAA